MAGFPDDGMPRPAVPVQADDVETAVQDVEGFDPSTPNASAEIRAQKPARREPSKAAAAIAASPTLTSSTGEAAPPFAQETTPVIDRGASPSGSSPSADAASEPSTAGLSTSHIQTSPTPRSAAARLSAGGLTPAACAAPSPPPPPTYLAAGVLPFCILGGDLLFLLGQELRFRSRVRGGSCGAMKGFSTPAAGGVAGRGDDRGAHEVPKKLSSTLGVPPLRRPRRGPRPKVSLSSTTASGESPAGAGGAPCVPAFSKEAPSPPPAATLIRSDEQPTAGEAGASSPLVDGNSDHRACMRPPQPALCDPESSGGSTESPSAETDDPYARPDEVRTGTPPGGVNPPGKKAAPAAVPKEIPVAAASPTAEGEFGRRRLCKEESAAAPGEATIPAGLLWSDFGGGREAGDADAEATASREFAEESFGMFHGVRLDGNSVARSQATMSTALRDPSLRGRRVFESRNGGYVMYVAEVDFVPDLMMNLARKEIVNGNGSDGSGRCGKGGRTSPSPGFSEKTDFAWVPASILLGAMRESRNRSTRKVVVKLGGGRYLRLFHKFVISLWGLDLPAVIKAALTPLCLRRPSLPPPRILLLKAGAGDRSRCERLGKPGDIEEGARVASPDKRERSSTIAGWSDGSGGAGAGGKSAIRGIDCVRPSFLSGRKRTSLGIIEVGRGRRPPPERSDSTSESEVRVAAPPGGDRGGDGCGAAEGGRDGDGRRRSRSKKSGAACRKRRRQCKAARRLKAAATAVAAAAAAGTAAEGVAVAAGLPGTATIPAGEVGGVEIVGTAVVGNG